MDLVILGLMVIFAALALVFYFLFGKSERKISNLIYELERVKKKYETDTNNIEREYTDKLTGIFPKIKEVSVLIQESKKRGENQIYFVNGEVPIEILRQLVKDGYNVRYEPGQKVGSPSRIMINWHSYPILGEEDIRNLYREE